MKNTLIKGIALIALISIVITACNPLKKMAKRYPEVKYEVTPPVLTLKGDSVEFSVGGKVPANYFHKKAFVDFVPVLTYPVDGGTAKDQKTVTLRGEATDGEGQKVEFAKGGGFPKNIN